MREGSLEQRRGAYLFILQQIFLHDSNPREGFGMLGTPVGIEFLSAHARFARDENGEAKTVGAEQRQCGMDRSNTPI